MQDITRKYKVVNCVDENILKWNTELIEAMELEHVVSQAAQNLNDGETRHGSREAQAQEHEYLPEREQVQWTKHANTSSSRNDSQAQLPDITSRGGVLEECVYDRRPHDKSTWQS